MSTLPVNHSVQPIPVQPICQPNVWSPKKISVVTTTATTALGVITAGIVLGSVGGVGTLLFCSGCIVGLVDTALCIHACLKLRRFYRDVQAYQLDFPFDRFADQDKAFDWTTFDANGRLYFVIWVKEKENYSALFFLGGDFFKQKREELMATHTLKSPSAVMFPLATDLMTASAN